MINQFKSPTFGGFKPDAMQRIAGTLGYSGDMSGFQQYLANNPDKQAQMDQFKQAAMMMAKGGSVQKFNQGGGPAQFGGALYSDNYGDPESAQKMQQAQQAQAQQLKQQFMNQASMQLGPNVTTPQVSTPQPLYTTQQTGTGFQVLDQSGKVVKTNLDDFQQAQDYAQQQGGTLQQQATDDFGMPIIIDDGPYFPPDLGGYDPSQGMPDPLGEDVINQYTTDVPSHFNTELKQMFTSGNIPADPTDYTISGKSRDWTITYADGTTIKNRARKKASVENDAANIIPNYINTFKESPEYTQKKAQQDAYRNYLTESTTGELKSKRV